MRTATSLTLSLGMVLWARSASGLIPEDEQIMGRGDANSSGTVDISDASYITSYLFHAGPAPPCMNQADANDDGLVDASDAIYLLDWLFDEGPAPPAPGPFNTECDADDYPYPGCDDPAC